ncbi:MAG: hypothetical protein ACYS1A_08160 [Planctomycetota bacterium]|jgi:hypothetical protein
MIDMDFGVTPTLDQLKEWIVAVEKEVLGDLTSFWDDYASPLVIDEMSRIFVTEGYGTWAALSPRYKSQKEKNYPGKTILRRKDTFFQAVTRKDVQGNRYFRDADKMVWGVDIGFFKSTYGFPYPVAHEFGTGKMPARPVFSTAAESERLQNELVNGLKDYLHKKINEEAAKVF